MTITSLDRIAGTEALKEAQRAFEAAGFVVVPKEPTKKMIDAAVPHVGLRGVMLAYCAMLDAAPKLV